MKRHTPKVQLNSIRREFLALKRARFAEDARKYREILSRPRAK